MTERKKIQIGTVHQALVTDAWRADVATLDCGIREFPPSPGHANDYHVSMFELAGDPRLHANVIHAHETKPGDGMGSERRVAGRVRPQPALRDGVDRILHDIRKMVFAPRA
jgi:hypothetical protein